MLSIHFPIEKTVSIQTFDKNSNSFFSLPCFQATAKCLISGHITVQPVKFASLQIQLIGSIENYQKNEKETLTHSVRSLGDISLQGEQRNYEFNFELDDVSESVKATNFEMKYFIKAVLYDEKGVRIEEIEKEFGIQRQRDETRRIEKLSMDLYLEDIFGYLFEMNKTEYYTDEIAIAKIRILKVFNQTARFELRLLKIEFVRGKTKNDFERYDECICIQKAPSQIMRKGDVFGLKVNLNLYNLAPSASLQNSKYEVTYQFRIVLRMWDRFFGNSYSVKLWSPRSQ